MQEDFNQLPAVLGRDLKDLDKYGSQGTAYIGKVVMSSGEKPVLGRKVLVDVSRPHLMLICGKRGGGKSYTLAVLMEEMARLDPVIKNRVSAITIDTVGIFWGLKLSAGNDSDLKDWDLSAQKTNVKVLVPKGQLAFYEEKKLPIDGAFTLKCSELEETEWMALFRLSWRDPEGILLSRAVQKVREKVGTYYGIDDIISAINSDEESDKSMRQGMISRMQMVKGWNLIEKEGTKISELASPGMITVI
ncbi:MAG: DUF87 domain-containing protein, partial [archaeon]